MTIPTEAGARFLCSLSGFGHCLPTPEPGPFPTCHPLPTHPGGICRRKVVSPDTRRAGHLPSRGACSALGPRDDSDKDQADGRREGMERLGKLPGPPGQNAAPGCFRGPVGRDGVGGALGGSAQAGGEAAPLLKQTSRPVRVRGGEEPGRLLGQLAVLLGCPCVLSEMLL